MIGYVFRDSDDRVIQGIDRLYINRVYVINIYGTGV